MLKPITIDGEWTWNGKPNLYSEHTLVLNPWTKSVNGVPSWRFPNGGFIYGYRWQAMVRATNHVVLLVLAVHHKDGSYTRIHPDILNGETNNNHEMGLMGLKMRLLPGDVVFVGGNGWGDATQPNYTAVEVQSVIWVGKNTLAVPYHQRNKSVLVKKR